jgi:hypothetical protein
MVKLLLVLAFAGCATDLDAPAQVTPLDREYFRCNVQPVIEARCSFPACHGSARRPFQMYGVGRMRYGVGWDRPTAPLTQKELDDNFVVASGFTTTTGTGEAWLLAKPLDTSAGGYFHRGATLYGNGDVFMTRADTGYQMLANWIAGSSAQPSCQPITEVGP